MTERLVKSKQRIAAHGEVFTGQREVKAMTDAVDPPVFHPEVRVLEPACGDGNFLVEILKRRLDYLVRQWGKPSQQADYEKNLVLAMSTLYGVELQEDNVLSCRQRLTSQAFHAYKNRFKKKSDPRIAMVLAAITEANILHGDALKLTDPTAQAQPLAFTEWTFAGPRVARRKFVYAHLLDPKDAGKQILSDEGNIHHLALPVETLPTQIWRNLMPTSSGPHE